MALRRAEAVRSTGTLALLDLLEPGWRNHVQAGGLGAAVEAESGLTASAAVALARLARQEGPVGLARRRPGCVVVALACVAAGGYRRGAFWPSWHRACRARASRAAEVAWGEAFLEALRVLGRPLPLRPAEAVLVHAAIPDSCLGEALNRLAVHSAAEARRGAGPAWDAADDVEGLERVDPAVGLLLQHGGESARELVGRLRAALLGVEAEEAAELPLRYRDAVRHASLTAAVSPPLRLDPYGGGVLLADDGDGGPAAGWRAATPREAGVENAPLLVFDEDGALLSGALPRQVVWVLRQAASDLLADVPLRTVVESRLPLPWRDWRLTQVALDGAAWLTVGGDRRKVRGGDRPRLVPGEPVLGLSTEHGLTVLPCPPSVRLPAGDARWRVEVRRAEGGPPLARAEATSDQWHDAELWARAPRPLLGELVVTADRADGDGPGMRRTVFVAEGLAARYEPPLRLSDDAALETGHALLDSGPGTTIAPGALVLAPGVVSAGVTVVAGPVVRSLRVTPPHLRSRIEPEPGEGRTPAPWQGAGPLRLGPDDLYAGGALRLDLPGVAHPPAIEVLAADRTVQCLYPSGQGRYPLRRLLDTAAAHGALELRASLGGRVATVARVQAPVAAPDPWRPEPVAAKADR